MFDIVERRNFLVFTIERYPTLTENTRPSGERTSLRFSKSARLKWMEHGDIRGSGYETNDRYQIQLIRIDNTLHKVYHGVPAWSGTRRGTHRQRKEAVPLLVSFLDGW